MGRLDSLAQEMDLLATVSLLYDPGERWVSGLGHDVQARLIEVFSGGSYSDTVTTCSRGEFGSMSYPART